MEPNAFVAEVYRRMSFRTLEQSGRYQAKPPTADRVAVVVAEYAPYLPADKDAKILDIGYGDGWFMEACKELGYTDISGADFGDVEKNPYLVSSGFHLHSIEHDIGDFLADRPEQFDFIHLAHVIEHIPKYSLFWIGDSLFRALRQNGSLFLRTPNMEGPAANSAYYVTLGHEYGFSGSNLESFLSLCGFENIRLLDPPRPRSFRQRIGAVLRRPFLTWHRWKHRFFGANQGGQFGAELVATAIRGNAHSFYDEKYR